LCRDTGDQHCNNMEHNTCAEPSFLVGFFRKRSLTRVYAHTPSFQRRAPACCYRSHVPTLLRSQSTISIQNSALALVFLPALPSMVLLADSFRLCSLDLAPFYSIGSAG